MAQLTLTDADLAAVVVGLELQRERIDARIAEIRQALDGRTAATVPTEDEKPRKKRSAAVRRRMALAQRARFAKLRQAAEPQEVEKPKKRKLSVQGRKNIIAA